MPLPSTMTPIATQTLTAVATSITFSSIPSNYTDLMLVANAVTATAGTNIMFRANSASGASSYYYTLVVGTGSSASSGSQGSYTTAGLCGYWTSGTSASEPNHFRLHFINYANTTTYKPFISRYENASATYGEVGLAVGSYRSTSAISSIQVYAGTSAPSVNFNVGATFTLYGIKAA
jgi:hypothetical protein